MIGHVLYGFLDNRRRGKIHICDPHRDAGVAGDIIQLFHRIPFHAMGAAPVDRGVKAHGPSPWNMLPQIYRAWPYVQALLARAHYVSYMTHMKRPILYHPDPRLKKHCAPVEDLSDDLRSLADDMLATMYDAPGVGLAAPQVGVLSRLIA